MRSQIPRENQEPSVQTSSDSAQNQVGASGMPSSPIRGDYQHLVEDARTDPKIIALYLAWRQLRETRETENAEPEEQNKKVIRARQLIKEGKRASELKKKRISAKDFTDALITLCIEKGWTAEDFKQMHIRADQFKPPHILQCQLHGWDYKQLLQLGKMKDEQWDTQFIETGWGEDHEKQTLDIQDPVLKNYLIEQRVRIGWTPRMFQRAGYTADDFTNEHITLCLENNWPSSNFEEFGIKGERFTAEQVDFCIRKLGWHSIDFEILEFRVDQFTEEQIDFCFWERNWDGNGFAAIGVRSCQISEEVFQAIEGNKESLTDENLRKMNQWCEEDLGKHDNINLAIKRGWTDEDFAKLGIRR